MDKEAPIWRKVFEMLEWSGSHIIRFSGWQDELGRELKEFISQANGWREELQQVKEENGELKKERKLFQTRITKLEEDGKRREGRIKRNLKTKEEACKRKLIKLAESFCGAGEDKDKDTDNTEAEEMDEDEEDQDDQVENVPESVDEDEDPPADTDHSGGEEEVIQDDVSLIIIPDSGSESEEAVSESEKDENRRVGGRTALRAGQREGEKGRQDNHRRRGSKRPREVEPEPAPTRRLPRGQQRHGQPQPPLRSIGNESLQPVLSPEDQSLFKMVTEGCLSSMSARQCHALERLSDNPRINSLLPKLAPFISAGIERNENGKDFKRLNLMLRMVKNLLNNPHVNLGEAEVSQLSDSVMSCVTAPYASEAPSNDHLWKLRDRAALYLGRIYRRSPNDDINADIRANLKTFIGNEQASLGSLYGAIGALAELGDEDAKEDLINNIEAVGDRLETYDVDHLYEDDKIAVANIQRLVLKVMGPILVSSWSPPDRLKVYNGQLGNYFGHDLQKCVIQLRRRVHVQPTRHSLRDRGWNSTLLELFDSD